MCTTCSECFADVYVGVKTHLCNIHTRPCTSAHNTCKVHVTLTAKNVHIYIPTHICIRMHMHTKTHAHAWHRPHAEALIPRPTIYAQICIHIHIHTFINVNARKARLKQRRGSDCAGSPTWHKEAPPFSLSASRQRAVQTTSAYLHWCRADTPSSLSTPAPSLTMARCVDPGKSSTNDYMCFLKELLKEQSQRREDDPCGPFTRHARMVSGRAALQLYHGPDSLCDSLSIGR